MIPVTKPFLPPRKEYEKYLKGIWKRNWLTNTGPLARKLEVKLKQYLKVPELLYVANGTLALQLAIRALNLKGEIITTPFSFVATVSSIVWEGCTPIFADIDYNSFNASPAAIENAITSKTSGILVTHVFGNPCDVDAIQKIADKYNLKIIYDAAHAFGVKFSGQSIYNFGDISISSLHATKLFHSVEGGIAITKDKELIKKLTYMRNFGFDGPVHFAELGINAKNSEFHAAMGLANFKYIAEINKSREQIVDLYNKGLLGLNFHQQEWHHEATRNYEYYPILFPSEELLISSLKVLNENQIFPRRYFYPSLTNSLPYVSSQLLKNTDSIAKRILCLPLYSGLSPKKVNMICGLLMKAK